jgi:hypothetical protein
MVKLRRNIDRFEIKLGGVIVICEFHRTLVKFIVSIDEFRQITRDFTLA